MIFHFFTVLGAGTNVIDDIAIYNFQMLIKYNVYTEFLVYRNFIGRINSPSSILIMTDFNISNIINKIYIYNTRLETLKYLHAGIYWPILEELLHCLKK